MRPVLAGGAELRRRRGVWLAFVLAVSSVALFAVAAWLESLNGDATRNEPNLSSLAPAILVVSLPILGSAIVARQPHNRVGWYMLVGGLLLSVGLIAHAWAVRALIVDPRLPIGDAAAWLATWVFVPGFGVLLLVIVRFPMAAMQSGWRQRADWLAVAAVVALAAAQAFAPDHLDGVMPGNPIPNPLGVSELGLTVGVITNVAVVVLFGYGCVAMIDLVRRVRRSPRDVRAKLRWVALALALFPPLIAVVVFEVIAGFQGAVDPTVYVGQTVVMVALTIAIGHAIVGETVFARTRAVDRTLSIVLRTGVLAVGYVALVGGFGAVLAGDVALAAVLAAAAVAGLLLTPMRSAVQHGINRFVYGSNLDPFAIVDALVLRLDAANDEPTAAAAIVATIASVTGLAHVAVELGSTVVAEHGRSEQGRERRYAITRNATALGHVIVSMPGTAGSLRPRDELMIDHIVRHAGPALHAQKLTNDVERSRAELVIAREAERRQIRRELHDGIGPSLAALALQLDAVKATTTDASASAIIDRINRELAAMVGEIRRVASGLRPPAIDELGLIEALEERSRALNATFELHSAQSEGCTLTAAVEVAIYLIASEALANAARHANARTCIFRLRLDDTTAHIEICDDGVGVGTTSVHQGIGMSSMRARAEELGGTFEVRRTSPGTTISAQFPIRASTPSSPRHWRARVFSCARRPTSSGQPTSFQGGTRPSKSSRRHRSGAASTKYASCQTSQRRFSPDLRSLRTSSSR